MKRTILCLLLMSTMFAFAQPYPHFDPVNPRTDAATRELLSRLYQTVDEGHILSGLHHNRLQMPHYMSDLNRIDEAVPGAVPPVWGGDLAWDADKVVSMAIDHHRRGFIIAITWHAARPFDTGMVKFREQTQGKFTQAQWDELVTEGSPMHQLWLAQVDSIAGYLRQLQDAGVPVLWRPFHEMNGDWFWWCDRRGERGFTVLWKMLYDRLTRVHQLNNLIWVWNPNNPRRHPVDDQMGYALYYPGDDYVDVLAADVYHREWFQDTHDQLVDLGHGKLIALGEVGELPTAEQLRHFNRYAWFMLWTSFSEDKYNTIDALRDVFGSKQVVNMPAAQSHADDLRSAVLDDLEHNLLPYWATYAPAPDGGFHGTVGADNQPVADAPRGSILTARILWTFARAYRYSPLPEYRDLADRAADYLISHFIDPTYGGVYWTVDAEGLPKDMTKQTYASSFAIYGLAEHFRATGDVRSLKAAQAIYHTLETRVHDHARMGYRETFPRDYSDAHLKGVDGHVGATKTMNSHIHLLEAYTALYQVWPNDQLQANLRELISILQTRLYSPATKHLILFCDDDWNNLGQVDSYGHDIETSWLLTEAAEALGDESLVADLRKQAVQMVDVALREGLSDEGYMRYEKVDGQMSSRISWWPQCEAIVGCINAWQITGKRSYYEAAERIWRYTQSHFIDREHEGWHMILSPDGQPTSEPKVSVWNCPYHNSRMAFELASRLLPSSVHSEVMAWSNITDIRVEGELVDFESSLRVGTIGGAMEATARERQHKIRYDRSCTM